MTTALERKRLDGPGEEREVAALARRHDACYELWPARTVVAGRNVDAGFDLELLGVNDDHGPEEAPGCPRCAETYRDLRRIATWVLWGDRGRARVDVGPYDSSWHEAPGRGLRPEVALQIRIAPAGGLGAPVDEPLRERLRELEERLARLGIPRGG